MSDQSVALVERLWEVLSVDDVVAGMADEALDARVRSTLMEIAEPDFEVRMLSPAELGGATFAGHGAEGFRSVWAEWVEPFEAFQIELEDRLEAGDDVLDLVNLTATAKTGGLQVEQPAAALWTVRNGRLARATFYLDRKDALRAAGLDPGRKSG
jgi:ketosteroid isomerase-like protein